MHVYTQPEQPLSEAVLRGLMGTVLGFGVASQFTFSVKADFLDARVRIPPQSHFN